MIDIPLGTIAWLYDDGLFCPACAEEKFGSALYRGEAKDTFGRIVSPLRHVSPEEACMKCGRTLGG